LTFNPLSCRPIAADSRYLACRCGLAERTFRENFKALAITVLNLGLWSFCLYFTMGWDISPPPKKNFPFPPRGPGPYIVTSQFTTQTASRLVQPMVFRVCLYFTIGRVCPPEKFFPLSSGGPCPDQTHCYFGPPQSTTRTASRSVQPFLQVSWLCRPSNRQTD